MFAIRQTAFPAHAGMNRLMATGFLGARRVPRACGDEPVAFAAALYALQRSPRMRG